MDEIMLKNISRTFTKAVKKPAAAKPKFKPTFKSVLPQFGQQSREALIKGIERTASAAILTLGPGGRNIVLDYENGDPKITKDGVTVVKSVFEFKREHELGSKLLKRVANNTNTFAGDGTTTSTLMSRELVQRGFKAIEFQGAHAIAIKRGMDKALKVVLGYLRDMAMPISEEHELKNVCMVSSNHNERIATIVSQVINTVGIDGVMNIVESPTGLTQFQLVNGLIFNRGLSTTNFIQKEMKSANMAGQFVEFENPLILVVGDRITSVEPLLPVLDVVKSLKRPFVLFSLDLQEEPASTLVYNSKRGIIECAAVNIPWTGGIEVENLKDIAAVTGATYIDNNFELELSEVQEHHFGSAQYIKIDEFQTSIVDGKGSKDKIEERKQEIKKTIQEEEKQHMKGVHQERLGRLSNSIAEIQVGGQSEVEKGEERDLIVDAINSAKSAIEGGVLPGGGVALHQASKLLEDGLSSLLEDESEIIGAKILGEAMKQPIRQMIWNKLGKDPANIIEKIEQEGDFFTGFDATKMEVCDLIDRGIYDSFKVIKVLLEDSVSLAGMVVSTECILVKQKSYTPLPLKHYQDRREFF